MFRKFIITVICCLSIFALSAVPSFAATMSDKEMAIEQISLCWQTSTNKKNVISFDSLTSLCADLNRNGYPCEIRFVSALNGYAILGTGYVHNTFESARVYSLSGKYYSNVEGSIFYSPYQSDSLLSSISTFLSAVSSTVSTISDTLSKWPSTLSTVSTISTNLYNFQTNVLFADTSLKARAWQRLRKRIAIKSLPSLTLCPVKSLTMRPPLACLTDISLVLPKISPKFFQLFFAMDLTILALTFVQKRDTI